MHSREAIDILGGRSSSEIEHDRTTQLALTKLVEIVGEAAWRVSKEARERFPEIPWREMIATRNRLSKDDAPIFDSIIVVTDRRILDKPIRDTIRQYAQIRSTVGHAERSGDLRRFIETGKKIIISTVQKFPCHAGAAADAGGDGPAARRFEPR